MKLYQSLPLLGAVVVFGACTPPTVPLSLASSRSVPTERQVSGMACANGDGVEALGKTFCALDEPSSWSVAEARCGELGGRLAQLVSPVDEVVVRAAFASPVAAQTLWLDLRRSDEGWRWGQVPAADEGWLPGEPNDSGGAEDCGEWSTSRGGYNDVPCDAQRAVMCEVPDMARCGAEGVETARGRYCLYPNARLSHGQARVLCQRTGGELARLETAGEREALRQTIGSLIGADRVWVGLSNRDGAWRWAGDVAATYGWLPGEPNNAGASEHCGEWRPNTGGFNDLSCEHELPALCEIQR